ncbi:TonB-dependent receptor family protein [Zobellia roscoffensis]|uniref:TonB-dependent receptor family protein n=1 Tax=Zobellia roscoffensis TaxID=2779508 RepID=UPI00188CAA4A|nr:TonB-dependent receptor family protein [Zobellia roscoffensis]
MEMRPSCFNCWIYLVLFFSVLQALCAQSSSITGTIKDENKEAMTFAHVLLLRKQDSALVKGVTTNVQGKFLLEDIVEGDYIMNVSLLGFESIFKTIEIKSPEEISLGPIQMTAQNQHLEGVEVVGKKALFQQKNDRLILNVSSQSTFSGNNALQVLQKAPGVIVQENASSISLNNKGEVLIMINNRISRVPQGALIQQLKGMRAENIERIELIHQPSAKYDANNAAGIIHIVLKENQSYGLNGNASLTVGMGEKEKLNGSLDLNYRNNRLNLYGSTTGFRSKSPMWRINHYRQYDYLGDEYFYENKLRFTNPSDNSLGFTMGVDFEIDKNKIIGAIFGYTKNNMSGHDYTSKSIGIINEMPDVDLQFLLDIDNPNVNTFANINYFWQLTPASSLNLDMDRVLLDVQNSSFLNYINSEDTVDATRSNRDSQFEVYTVKGDFEWKNEKGTRIETGLKGTFNNSSTMSATQNRNSGSWVEDEAFGTDDDISENILAAHGAVQKKWNDKWESNLGLRLEHYAYKLEEASSTNDFEITYTNLFPVVRTSYAIDSTRTFTLSFNRRIERPVFMNLAGFYLLIDPSLFVTSNTRIRPSFTNAVRLAYNYRSFLIAFEVNRTKGAISFYNTVDKEKNLQTSTPINFDSMDGLMLTMSFPIKLGKFWTMNWNLDGAYKKVKDASNRPLPFEKGLFTVTAQLSNVFDFGNSWSANIDGRYRSPFISGDQELYLRHYINLGVNKKFKNESSLTFSIQDLTATSGIIDWEYHQPELGIKTYGDNDWSERVFQVTYSFPFGNKKLKEKRNRQTGSQEERNRM